MVLSSRLRAGPAALAVVLLAAALAALAAPARAQVQPYGTGDYGGFRNVLPPGTNGLVNAAQLAAYEANHNSVPPHNNDQLAMYSNLTTAAPGIAPSQIGNFYKDATFGIPSGQVDAPRTESPEPGVTILRDKPFGVPHIYGDTRPELMFGIGWATAEDRLFFIDVLRHAGQGNLAQFAGGSNVAMDESVWASEPYTQQDLINQIDYGRTHSPYGPPIFSDAANFVNGINAYIAKATSPLNIATMLPAEYLALGTLPKPFTLQDLVSIATLVGGIFGNGGGDQLSNAMLYEHLVQKFGRERRNVAGSPQASVRPGRGRHRRADRSGQDRSGFATLLSFVDPADPEAPTTVRGKRFPYQTLPAPTRASRRTVALPDPGSVRLANTVVAGAVPRSAADVRSSAAKLAFPR